MPLGAGADWQDVMIAALALAGTIFNGLIALYIAKQVRTPSGGNLGQYVENATQAAQAAALTSTANHNLLRKMNGHAEDEAA